MNASTVEDAFICGIRANIEANASKLARELTGRRRAQLAEIREDNERQVVLDTCNADRASDPKPANRELWAVIRKGNTPLHCVGVKSFAAWQMLGNPSAAGSKISRYVHESRLRAGSAHCTLAILVPEGWPAEIDRIAWDGARSIVFCRRRHGLWFDATTGDFGWQTWLALTPMTLEARKQWCLRNLEDQAELRAPGGILRLSRMIDRLALPADIAGSLLKLTCDDVAARFRIGTASGGVEFIKHTIVR